MRLDSLLFLSLIVSFVICAPGCDSETEATDTADSRQETAENADADTLPDVSVDGDETDSESVDTEETSTPDTAETEEITSDTEESETFDLPETDDGEMADETSVDSLAEPEVDEDPWAGRPIGQCNVDADCPDGSMGSGSCSRAMPGGVCIGCGTDQHCPVGTDCSQYGSCATSCVEDDDCPPGMSCALNGLCRAASCVDGACPVEMFACSSSNLCERASCVSDDCPPHTTCVNGLCIEDRNL